MKPETGVQHRVVHFYRGLMCQVTPIASYRSGLKIVPPGYPDLTCMHPRIGAFFHETKTKDGKLSKEQLAFMKECMRCNVPYVHGGVDEAQEFMAGKGVISSVRRAERRHSGPP